MHQGIRNVEVSYFGLEKIGDWIGTSPPRIRFLSLLKHVGLNVVRIKEKRNPACAAGQLLFQLKRKTQREDMIDVKYGDGQRLEEPHRIRT